MSKVRVGVIGTGGMAQSHIKMLHAHPNAEVTALCDIKPAALERTTERHPELKEAAQFSDYREMLTSGLVDSVAIVTPHTVHYEQIMTSLDHGMHVLCEKPMVCKVFEAHNVLKQIEQSGKVFVLSYQRHYQKEFLYIKREIDSGKYGPVQFVQGLQCQNWYRGTRGAWRQDPKLSGGGQLNDSGSHLLGVVLFITGLSVESVCGFIDNFDVPVDINSALSLKFVGGGQGNLSIVGNSPTWHEDITIWCDSGIFFMRNGILEVCGPDGKRFKPEASDMPVENYPDTNFINSILGKETVGSSAEWGLRVIELTESAWKSAEEKIYAPVVR